MEQKREAKPDVRLDIAEFSDEVIQHAVAFLMGGVATCKKNEGADPRNAEVGKLLLSLAVLLGYHLPPPEPSPAAKAALN